MATTQDGSARITVSSRLESAEDNSTPVDALEWTKFFSFKDGTGADKGDVLYHDTVSIDASGTEVLDIDGLTDKFGNTQDSVALKLFAVYNGSSYALTIDSVNLLSDASDKIKVPVGALVLIACPTAVGLGTKADITITNTSGAGAATGVQIVLIGASAAS